MLLKTSLEMCEDVAKIVGILARGSTVRCCSQLKNFSQKRGNSELCHLLYSPARCSTLSQFHSLSLLRILTKAVEVVTVLVDRWRRDELRHNSERFGLCEIVKTQLDGEFLKSRLRPFDFSDCVTRSTCGVNRWRHVEVRYNSKDICFFLFLCVRVFHLTCIHPFYRCSIL